MLYQHFEIYGHLPKNICEESRIIFFNQGTGNKSRKHGLYKNAGKTKAKDRWNEKGLFILTPPGGSKDILWGIGTIPYYIRDFEPLQGAKIK